MAYVFSFNSINKSQLAFLSHLVTQKTALIIGGGTGYFLQKLLIQNAGIHITYVDVSAKMIAYSRKRIEENCPKDLDRVNFICAAVEDLDYKTYDVIVCNYILDLFDNAAVKVLAEKFKKNLNPEGLLYVTDFHIAPSKGFLKWSTEMGLKILYAFFRYTTELKTKELPKTDSILKEQGFFILESKSYLSGILMCRLYKVNG